MLTKGDFYADKNLKQEIYKNNIITNAVKSAETNFNGINPLNFSILKSKKVYRVNDFFNELVLRKVNSNIKNAFKVRGLPGRETIVANIARLISEGVPYRIYRLDVKSFYESFLINEVLIKVENNFHLSLPTKRLIRHLLEDNSSYNGSGLPRGISISATLSEIMMNSFDSDVRNMDGVYFYARYVDDIIILTNCFNDENKFVEQLGFLLPEGLSFNKRREKKNIESFIHKVEIYKTGKCQHSISFEYLGYKFAVFPPKPINGIKPDHHFRDVVLDIADRKTAKIKTRIVRSIIDYNNNNDFDLLLLRIKYLTSNFSVSDKDRERKRLAGIYYNYHQISANEAKALAELDKFLKIAILSNSGKVYSQFFSKTDVIKRRKLRNFSFSKGFSNKSFVHFSALSLNKIQECWKYE